jgi:hypothetical protein
MIKYYKIRINEKIGSNPSKKNLIIKWSNLAIRSANKIAKKT